MRFKYYNRITNKKILDGIKELLSLCDKEFVPPLSSRISTSQADLTPDLQVLSGIDEYFNEVAEQSAIVVTKKDEVVAFISFKKDYTCEHISLEFRPNLYVTTIIVSPKYRNQNLAGLMYDFLVKKFPKHYIFTRTWSTNLSHIRILLTKKFHEH